MRSISRLKKAGKRDKSTGVKGRLANSAVVAVAVGFFAVIATVLAAEKSKSTEFAGTVTAVDQVAKTITVKGQKGSAVIEVDTRRCSFFRNGSQWWVRGLEEAMVGDAVWGTVSLAGAKPTVVSLDFTSKPLFGLPVRNKPGFVISPYASPSRLPIDVRRSPRGAMLKDPSTGKIFLVP